MEIPAKLQKLANSAGYLLEYRPTVKRRGWPTESAKPFGLYFKDGAHLSSFKTLAALESAIRARAGC